MTIRQTVNAKEVPPSPSRMIEGLRDTGYDFNTAMADIIDNSIAANASQVEITIDQDFAGELRISIADNGCGMDESGLLNAMRYGSDERDDPGSLGKFGLGLKTASTAFCRCLSVVTRSSKDAPVLKARWDLDHVRDERKWELLFLDPTDEELDLLDEISKGDSGTVVVWEKVDRVIKSYIQPDGKHARNALERTKKDLSFHVGMVYQRFLNHKDDRATNVQIKIDGVLVSPWDPFCIDESDLLAKETVSVDLRDGTEAPFHVSAYVLPRDFSTEEAAKVARVSNDMQGIYIYRENRLIHHASWLKMYRKEPHGSLLRVEFSFDHRLDEAFYVDVKKSRILLDDELFFWLKESFLPAPRRVANERYRDGKKKLAANASKSAHDSSNKSIGAKEPTLRLSNIEVVDSKKNEVEVTNPKGKIRIKLPLVAPTKEGKIVVQPIESIDDGLLWKPCLIDNHLGFLINTGHPYYRKVYVPNLSSGVTIQGMDALLWALSQAELGTINEVTKGHLEEIRYHVSRLLNQLVEELPEPESESDVDE